MAQREKIVLDVSVRDGRGKSAAGELRREGAIPGVVYKDGKDAISVQVSGRELGKVLHTKAGANVLINLRFGEGSKDRLKGHADLAKGEGMALVKELQHHPVTHQLVHVDFHQVSLTQKITVAVPLAFKGEAIGVKQQAGVLEHLRWEVEVECLPTEIPAEIPVEISGLELGKTLHVKDLALPPGVRSLTDPEQPVVACVEPKKEELPTPAAEGGAAPTEPEVIKQKKPEEEAEGAAGEVGKEKEAKPKAAAPAEGKKG